MSGVSVSVVIRALNEADHLPALLSALSSQTMVPDEVIVVDSGSIDDTVSIATKYGAVVVHIAPSSFSFGRALNLGCEAANGDILVFASAHVYPTDSRWLECLVAPFDEPDVALVYGRQIGDHRSQFSEMELMKQWFPLESVSDQGHPFCNNANAAVLRAWWARLPYNEALTGLEDLDWANRALAEGGRIMYRADATVVHVHQEVFQLTRNRYRREAIAHRQIFNDQYVGLVESLGLFASAVVHDYRAAIGSRRLLCNLWPIPRFRAAQYLGTWDGFRTQGSITEELRRRFYYPTGSRVGAVPGIRRRV